MRTYGGTGNPTVTISAAGNEIATLTAKSKTLTVYSWTNTNTLSGKSELLFTANKSNSQGVGFSEIIVDVTGSGTSYSYERYITDFQSPTEISNLQCPMSNVKLLINNQLYILVGDQLFNLQGQRVK